MKILFATHNNNKLREAREILKNHIIIGLSDLCVNYEEVEETGKTFFENAYLKAKYFYDKYDLPTIADDTGICCYALNLMPGVHSKRLSKSGNDFDNINKLLMMLENKRDKRAYFSSVICFIFNNKTYFFEGKLEGLIINELRGNNGFGYDPIFYIEKLNKTLAELEANEKNEISHRRDSLDRLENFLKEIKMEEKILLEAKKVFNTDKIEIMHRLLGGMSNVTYVIKVYDKLYTFRYPGEKSEYFVDRSVEEKNIKLFEKLGVTNKTTYFSTETGIKVSEYIEGTSLNLISNEKYPFEDVAMLLKKIHNVEWKSDNDYNPFKRLEKYEQYCIEKGFVLPKSYLNIRDKFFTYKDYLQSLPKSFAHGDSQPSNFIITGRGLKVVDFEFTGNIDHIYDIACFANMRISDGEKLLETYYFGDVKDNEWFRFYSWRCFQCLQWFNVAVFKHLIGMSELLKINFLKVSEHYLDLANELYLKAQTYNKL
ncbi:MAG: RdgB/HAM1 family non-canonical purine NTP pyrophosphatase [Bacilli bacterium]|jgi:non-canonical purine NTP pyrophosphatase (RdgB/HAM1 family)|nr:RdgB/HAM1 family non-canonical purine NTP pyrophosphatase [Bacilli bacterium]